MLTADVNLVEAEQDTPAGHGEAEAQFRTEAGKQQHLIDLLLHHGVIGARQYLVANDLSLSIEGRLQQQVA